MVGLGTWTTRWKELRETFFDGLVDTELGQSGVLPADASSVATAESSFAENIPLKELK